MIRVACLIMVASVCSAVMVNAGEPARTLAVQLADLREWAGLESSRIGTLLAGVDPKFAGVRRFGETLSARPSCNTPVASLTDSSGIYWRARLEMVPNEPSVLLAGALLHAKCGEVDKAVRLVQIIRLLPITDTPATSGFTPFSDKLTAYISTRNALIQSGIDDFDTGKLERAKSCYDSLLQIDPSSAWAWHERFLAMGAVTDNRVHDEYRRRVYGADPLYPRGMYATTGVQAFQIGRRMEIPSLFKSPDRLRSDILALATIALDVEAYGLGAELFWTSVLAGPGETRSEAIDGFLYCLHRLGVEDISTNFVGDNAQRIHRVELARSQRLQASPFYQAMRTKE